jgi:hypothetical protein
MKFGKIETHIAKAVWPAFLLRWIFCLAEAKPELL